jgi:hypothetical protein
MRTLQRFNRNFRKFGALSIRFDPQGSNVMPILLWIAFWSSMKGVAKGWQETMMPIRVKVKDHRDQPTE